MTNLIVASLIVANVMWIVAVFITAVNGRVSAHTWYRIGLMRGYITGYEHGLARKRPVSGENELEELRPWGKEEGDTK